jgi:hypothetical protein
MWDRHLSCQITSWKLMPLKLNTRESLFRLAGVV